MRAFNVWMAFGRKRAGHLLIWFALHSWGRSPHDSLLDSKVIYLKSIDGYAAYCVSAIVVIAKLPTGSKY
ncbi:hypothetical protein BEL04_11625 [Mucilaginibacter sp. PPCGB 2223]|nr:hypothetical protein BEL04_11625 [Mucilaginibacter sp. PPCGB 2223]